ncbi:NAD(P)/FAD-dependent oxidoreductase [Halorientalis brevis]|uniref:NAD(P)/FAD-dependent oxidoreductase n=1 Tax=Halorientalis brevis TaxID=1126241 RepID=A0ABD6CIQ9_9EURY|nr:NAD(P)/FAD-dependent oxidoreductase [Halorientalis brevis]
MTDEGATTAEPRDSYDVVIVGGGPAGCSAGVFCARYGLETAVFDRGRSSLKRCAYLENYLGFPAGIDVESFYDLIHDHVTEAGCDLVPDLVESVERTDAGFRVETQEDSVVKADHVVAAAKYDAEYLRPLGTSDAMFETYEHDGEAEEFFDRDYPDDDGRTPIGGLYVAGPLAGVGDQAIIAAGHGATVGRNLIADVRREDGYWDEVAEPTDWLRREAELDETWEDRDAWREWFDGRVPDGLDRDSETIERVREAVIDATLETYVSKSDIATRTERGQRRLAAHVDDEIVLDAVDDAVIEAYLDTGEVTAGDD